MAMETVEPPRLEAGGSMADHNPKRGPAEDAGGASGAPTNEPDLAPGSWVLLVEPSEDDRSALAALIRQLGYEVLDIGSGVDAVDFVAAAEFSLVLIHSGLAVTEGVELVRAMRALEGRRTRRAPVFVVLAHRSAVDRAAYLSAGADEVLEGPATANDLRDAVARQFPVPGEPFQHDVALEAVAGEEERLRATLLRFTDELPLRLATIRAAWQEGDTTTLGLAAGALADFAHRVAMRRVRDLCHRISAYARKGQVTEAGRLVAELEAAAARAKEAAMRSIGAA